MASLKITNAVIDMSMSTVSDLSNVFDYDVERSISGATGITIQNINLAEVYYYAVPAWYDATNKRLYAANIANHYWAVNGNKLTYT